MFSNTSAQQELYIDRIADSGHMAWKLREEKFCGEHIGRK